MRDHDLDRRSSCGVNRPARPTGGGPGDKEAVVFTPLEWTLSLRGSAGYLGWRQQFNIRVWTENDIAWREQRLTGHQPAGYRSGSGQQSEQDQAAQYPEHGSPPRGEHCATFGKVFQLLFRFMHHQTPFLVELVCYS
jgi:hypothetical protein